jgi:hypothetical protein
MYLRIEMAIMAIGGEIYDPCLLDMVKGLKETTPQ